MERATLSACVVLASLGQRLRHRGQGLLPAGPGR